MVLELAFKKLSIRPATLCHQCRRAFASSPRKPAQRDSATRSFAEHMQATQSTSTAQQELPRSAPVSPSIVPPTPNSPADRAATQTPRTAYEIAEESIRQSSASLRQQQERARQEELERNYTRADLEKQATRRFRVGDVYAPHDLTGVEMAKWKRLRRKGKPKWDVIDQLGINPIHHYKNFSMMSEYMSDMGRIKHRKETSLRPVNQRRMAKAIRRAIGVGLMPGVHRHPEILRRELEEQSRRRY